MGTEAKIWRVAAGDKLEALANRKLDLEGRLETWLENDIKVLDESLLIIGRQVETAYGGVIDLLCVDANGDLTIVELKRGKTAREITAQVLDYASWIDDLSHEDVRRIADDYLGRKSARTFEVAFRDAFRQEVPDVLNGDHRMVVVGAAIDDVSERIIRYLSERHSVNINSAAFSILGDREGPGEFLARVFQLEPEEVQQRSSTTSKRAPALTTDQLQAIAEENGVGAAFRVLGTQLEDLLSRHTTRSTLAFEAQLDGGRRTVVSLHPGESSEERGVRFYLYSNRLQKLLGIDKETLLAALPTLGREDWKYFNHASDDFAGYRGFFRTEEEGDRFRRLVEARLTPGG